MWTESRYRGTKVFYGSGIIFGCSCCARPNNMEWDNFPSAFGEYSVINSQGRECGNYPGIETSDFISTPKQAAAIAKVRWRKRWNARLLGF